MCRKIFLSTLALFLFVCIQAQKVEQAVTKQNFVFEANKNQWPANVNYMADISGGRVFFESNHFTFVLHSLADLNKAHEDSHKNKTDMRNAIIHAHAYRMNFLGANEHPLIEANNKQSAFRNYFIGSDQTKWAADVPLYSAITYNNLYNGVDLTAYGNGANLEYDYIVHPGTDPNIINIAYEGLYDFSVVDGNLILKTSIGDVTEQHPFAYQIINGVKKEVRCNFSLTIYKIGQVENEYIGFSFPDGYDKNEELIIDPILVASTYSGSTSTNYGHCATYDATGNIYTGAISFGPGYPATVGSFQTTFAGQIDIAISKLNPTGSSLIYATYIGGTDGDYPHSLVVNGGGEIFVYGSSSSANFPTTAGCFDNSLNNASGTSDIVVCHLNSAGNVMIGSTFVGGSGSDGNNSIYVNYGDTYRGEIVLDGSGNPCIASFSQSSNFPVTAGCFDNSLGGTQDGVVFEMNAALTSMMWGTYLGGSGDDGSYGLSFSSAGDVYVVGATASNNFPTTPGALHPTYIGGVYDGYITCLTGNGSAVSKSTYYGASNTAQDEIFFLDLDAADNVYVYGQSTGSVTTTAGVYSNPGSPQFISKLNPALNTVLMSTVFGDGTMASTLTPTAFMVDVCDHIYAAGWGSVANYPISGNAVQNTTDGSDFYLVVLDQNATAMMYATWFGANGGWEHVDGGTSRFDPNGIVYEAICQGASNMTTTPGAYSPNNLANSWDIAVFKIDFQSVGVIAQALAAPNDTLCVNQTATFANNSLNSVDYIWNFGDASPLDTNASPTHIYTNAGTYTVTLIAIDSTSCNFADTTYLTMTILPLPIVNLGNDTTFCGPVNKTLNATTPSCTYLWSTGATTATITVNAPGVYWVQVDNGSCSATDTMEIFSFQPPNLGSDTTICSGNAVLLDAGNPGSTYLWSTGAITQTILVNSTAIYWVDVTSGNCSFRDSIDLTVIIVPQPNLGNDTSICPGQPLTYTAPVSTASYLWSTGSSDQSIVVDTAGTYWVTMTIGGCTASDTVNVNFLSTVSLGADVSLCDLSAGLVLDAGNPNSTYLWSTGETTQTISVNESGTYWVTVTNSSQCLLTDTITAYGDVAGTLLYIPNCFTPTGDDKNEIFKAESSSVTSFHMQIFNRWGQLIFESFDINNGWDGRYKGNIVQEDVYVVKIEYTSVCSGKQNFEKIAHVTVLSKHKK